MLILVAVTISMAINGGLFEQAGEAVGKTQNAVNEEQEIANGGIQIDRVWYNSMNDYIEDISNHNIARIVKIGDYVNYQVDYDNDGNTKDDWRVLFNDGVNVYLIASKYIPGNTGTSTPFSTSLWEYNTEDNAITYLLDRDIWIEQYGNDKAKYVQGAPTIEMLVKSWNTMYPEEKLYIAQGEEGLYVGTSENSTTTIVSMSNTNDLYSVKYGELPYCTGGMWVASKAENGYLMRVYYSSFGVNTDNSNLLSGNVIANMPGVCYMGLRPVVCLKEDLQVISGEGTSELPYEL